MVFTIDFRKYLLLKIILLKLTVICYAIALNDIIVKTIPEISNVCSF